MDVVNRCKISVLVECYKFNETPGFGVKDALIKALDKYKKSLLPPSPEDKLIGKNVFTVPGLYSVGGVRGVVENERGFGSLKAVEIQTPDNTISVVRIEYVRIVRGGKHGESS